MKVCQTIPWGGSSAGGTGCTVTSWSKHARLAWSSRMKLVQCRCPSKSSGTSCWSSRSSFKRYSIEAPSSFTCWGSSSTRWRSSCTASRSSRSKHRVVVLVDEAVILVEEVVAHRRRRGTGDDVDRRSWCTGTDGEHYIGEDVMVLGKQSRKDTP
jgi:hypothetical protein